MDQRRWDELDIDCMTNIFGRVGMESLLLDVPFVCKPWYQASLNPSCWQNLIFPVIEVDPFKLDLQREYPWKFDPFLKRFVSEYRIDGSRFSVTAFIKFVIYRSRGHATELRLPAGCSEEALKYAADMCPGLKRVSLSDHKPDIVLEILSKWKDLEWLLLGECRTHLEKIVSQISIHCKNFTSLNVPDALIGKIEALTIATLLPNIKHLNIRWATIDRSSLRILLRGCKELVSLDARNCVGFDAEDETVLKLASHIRGFCFEGSRASDYGGDISCRPS